MTNDVFRNNSFRIDEHASKYQIVGRHDSSFDGRPWNTNKIFCSFNSKEEMYCLYMLMQKYLGIESTKSNKTFYSKAIVNQDLLDTLEMLQEDDNAEIKNNSLRLSSISRLICEWRIQFGLSDKEILEHIDSINNTIYLIEQMKV